MKHLIVDRAGACAEFIPIGLPAIPVQVLGHTQAANDPQYVAG